MATYVQRIRAERLLLGLNDNIALGDITGAQLILRRAKLDCSDGRITREALTCLREVFNRKFNPQHVPSDVPSDVEVV